MPNSLNSFIETKDELTNEEDNDHIENLKEDSNLAEDINSQVDNNKIEEEIDELKVAITDGNKTDIEEEAGDLLFSVVSLSRHTSIDPETAIRKANRKFERRFRAMEQLLKQSNKEFSKMSSRELDDLWEQVKATE